MPFSKSVILAIPLINLKNNLAFWPLIAFGLYTLLYTTLKISRKGHLPSPIKFFKLLYFILGAIFPIFQPRKRREGDSHFAGWFEKKSLINGKNGGFVMEMFPKLWGICGVKFNRLSAKDSFGHVAAIAKSRIGKTSTLVYANIFGLQGEKSIVVSDPKGEILEKIGKWLTQQGYTIKCFNPLKLTDTYNRLANTYTEDEWRKTAEALIINELGYEQAKTVWGKNAQQILFLFQKGLYNYCQLYDMPEAFHLPQIRHMANQFNAENKGSILDPIMSCLDDLGWSEWNGIRFQSERVLQDTFTTILGALSCVQGDHMSRLSGSNTFDFSQLRKEKTALFIQIPERGADRFKWIFQLLMTDIIDLCYEEPEPGEKLLDVFFILDEFAHLGAIPQFEDIITTIGGRRCAFMIILQSLPQLEKVYGSITAKAILEGAFAATVIFGGTGESTCRTVSNLLGSKIVEEQDSNGRILQRKIPLLDIAGVRELKTPLMIHTNKSGVRLDKTTPYYDIPSLKKWDKKPFIWRHRDQPLQAPKLIELPDSETIDAEPQDVFEAPENILAPLATASVNQIKI